VLNGELSSFSGKSDSESNQAFVRNYVNKPAWEEPLRMLAEEIGQATTNQSEDIGPMVKACKLIELALDVDPVFAAELSRLCGEVVWRDVRNRVSDRLRVWYSDPDEHHRQCALAGMLASGSSDFSDVTLPLLTSNNEQIRLRTYRAWGGFHVSSPWY
jgi:hypothetical protein